MPIQQLSECRHLLFTQLPVHQRNRAPNDHRGYGYAGCSAAVLEAAATSVAEDRIHAIAHRTIAAKTTYVLPASGDAMAT